MQTLLLKMSDSLIQISKRLNECWSNIKERCSDMKLVKETDSSLLVYEMDSKLTFVNDCDPLDSVLLFPFLFSRNHYRHMLIFVLI